MRPYLVITVLCDGCCIAVTWWYVSLIGRGLTRGTVDTLRRRFALQAILACGFFGPSLALHWGSKTIEGVSEHLRWCSWISLVVVFVLSVNIGLFVISRKLRP